MTTFTFDEVLAQIDQELAMAKADRDAAEGFLRKANEKITAADARIDRAKEDRAALERVRDLAAKYLPSQPVVADTPAKDAFAGLERLRPVTPKAKKPRPDEVMEPLTEVAVPAVEQPVDEQWASVKPSQPASHPAVLPSEPSEYKPKPRPVPEPLLVESILSLVPEAGIAQSQLIDSVVAKLPGAERQRVSVIVFNLMRDGKLRKTGGIIPLLQHAVAAA